MLALVFGILIFTTADLRYLEIMLVFFASAILVTKYEYLLKRKMGVYENERSWENVFSNGIVPTICAVFSSAIGPLPFLCSVAAITADKFASELGVFGGKPYSLLTGKKVTEGESGAVSVLGTIMSLAGGMVIGVGALILFSIEPIHALMIAFAGLVGSLVDSLVGILEAKGIGTKGTTNFICALAGAIIGIFIGG